MRVCVRWLIMTFRNYSLPAFHGATFQRGHGIGVFKGLVRSFAPVLKRSIKAV